MRDAQGCPASSVWLEELYSCAGRLPGNYVKGIISSRLLSWAGRVSHQRPSLLVSSGSGGTPNGELQCRKTYSALREPTVNVNQYVNPRHPRYLRAGPWLDMEVGGGGRVPRMSAGVGKQASGRVIACVTVRSLPQSSRQKQATSNCIFPPPSIFPKDVELKLPLPFHVHRHPYTLHALEIVRPN